MKTSFAEKFKVIKPLLISTATGALGFVAVAFSPLGKTNGVSLAVAVFSFFVTLTMAEHLKTASLINTQTEELNKSIQSLKEFEFLGPALECFGEAINKCHSADEIKNTLIWFGSPSGDYLKSHIEQIQQKIETLLQLGKSWTDIVSPETLAAEELGWLDFAARMKNKPNYRYKLYCLRHSYPMVNFTIARHKGVSQEVMFGWGHHPNDASGNVFASTKDESLSYFDALWTTLKGDTVPVDPRQSGFVTEAAIIGHWLTAAYKEDENLKDFAHVQTSSQNRQIEAVGSLFDSLGERIKDGKEFTFEAAHLKGIRLWFVSNHKGEKTLGWYNFRSLSGKIDFLSGHLNPDQQSKETWVFGVRLDEQDAAVMAGGGPRERQKIIEKRKPDIEKIRQAWMVRGQPTT